MATGSSNHNSSSPKGRRRGSSIVETLHRIEHDPNHHLAGPFVPDKPSVPAHPPQDPTGKIKHAKPKQKVAFAVDVNSRSGGLWEDMRTMRWMRVPASSAKILGVPILLWLNWHFLSSHQPNPFSHVILLSGRVPGSPDDDPRYQKSYWDILFITYYVVFWSFVRQSIVLYILHPLARLAGIRKEGKLDRFAEQGYAIIYFGFSSSAGIYIMRQLPTWWYRTEYFWIDYPHWDMLPAMKAYYLLQFAFWLQQFLVLVLRIEKPRKDFQELVWHHYVTLWLIGWSYLVNLTYIGNAVFVTMDFSDTFLSVSKILNYLKLDRISVISFIWFIGVWTYMRHYLNLRMLYSVWTQFELIAPENREWDPPRGVWLAWWMKYQIFVPIALIQLLNIFWYLLMWRVLYRAVFGTVIGDERSDDEDEPESPIAEKLSKED
ncbi:longevity assurance proteins LAG1/LAC1 [Dacryopinax primogenitus]|uniref:Longevity assurance proteins LAG1/LAC1 n=1 Tax=Dacryopinax primogenitus (strain DJM 731) TaxID=1858805 RepID=M5GGT3_DACPD|nr:longevity assurance proteins LAG1/LAC1 [Dacryopinax primogenitus]EJU06038.1 longevity assurance proteins LAG1/LAC1 [Dacryopinax primogenitus]